MPLIALIVDLPEAYQQRVRDQHELVRMRADEIAVDHAGCQSAQVVWTNGMVGLSDTAMACFPKLELIICQGVGYDGVDLAAASKRGIAVAAGRGVNSTTVADHAVALLLALLRDIPRYDQKVRAGEWLAVRRLSPILTGQNVGILGFGGIGQLIAQRLRGFDCTVRYHSRRPVEASDAIYVDSPVALAAASDSLLLCCPGGAATHHIIDAAVLDALGPDGVLVNIARGSVVDTDALLAALSEGRIAGAALDVIEGEPAVPEVWRDVNNVIFTPHTAGLSTVAFDEMLCQGLASVAAHSAGEKPLPGQVNG